MSAADHLRPEQMSLFNKSDYDEPVIDLSKHWAQRDDVVWHASHEDALPTKSKDVQDPATQDFFSPSKEQWPEDYDEGDTGWNSETRHPLGFHAGTAWSAFERAEHNLNNTVRSMHPIAVSGPAAPPPLRGGGIVQDRGLVWGDEAANGADAASTQAVRRGENVWYENDVEDVGTASVRAPRENLSSWREWVLRNPDEATYSERRAAARGAELTYYPVSQLVKKAGHRSPEHVQKDTQSKDRAKTSLPGLSAGELIIAQGQEMGAGFGRDPQPLVGRFRFPQRRARLEQIKQDRADAAKMRIQLPGLEGL